MTLLILLGLLIQDPVFPDVDPAPAIEAARQKAEKNNRRVLVVWGMNEPDASIPFAKLLKSDKQVARVILYEYDVVLADIRRMKKGDIKPAVIPILDIQDAGGRVIASQAGSTDVEALLKFLRQHAAPPQNAKEVLDAALKKAGEEKKRVILTFSAPWCGWCHRFAAWMAREDAAVFHKEFVPVKIDIDRMTGGKELLASYPKSEKQGIPWFVFLQPDGKELADSMGPNGNLGCPNADDEIETFLAILKKIAVNLTDDDLAALKKSLFAAQVKTK